MLKFFSLVNILKIKSALTEVNAQKTQTPMSRNKPLIAQERTCDSIKWNLHFYQIRNDRIRKKGYKYTHK